MANGSWRIARGRGSPQLPLAIAAVLAVVVLLAGRAHLLPFDRARTSLTDRAAPLLQKINAPVAATSRWFSGIGHFFDVYSENLRLREENARLRQWEGAALMLEGRMKRYQLLLNAVPDPALSAITARVIGRASHPFLQTMIVGAGKRSGVKPGEAVVDARGMLGRVYIAGDHTSWIVLLTDLNSRIPVSIQPKGIQAILAGENTDAPNIEALAQGVKLKAGQEVVTSGDGGLLPPGLPVGVLLADKEGFRVALFADPMATDEVRILDFKSPIEQLPVPTAHDLPAAAAGFKPKPPPPPPASNPAPPPAAVVSGASPVSPSPGTANTPARGVTIITPRQAPPPANPDSSQTPPKPPGPTGD